jgi:mannose-6-phosphate isomerase
MWGDENKTPTVEKPWGSYRDISRDDRTVFKELRVNPGASLSYQYHNTRSEFWYIMEGACIVTLDGEDINLSTNDHIFIGRQAKHRVKNIGEGPLVIREMQCGLCSEDDIVRLRDEYGRTSM